MSVQAASTFLTPLSSIPETITQVREITFENAIYKGDVKDGQPHGQGKKTWNNGDYAEGTFINGTLNGQGKKVVEKTTYEGTFVNGKLNGVGKVFHCNGWNRVGRFKDDRCIEDCELMTNMVRRSLLGI
jgi:hypothetical protein